MTKINNGMGDVVAMEHIMSLYKGPPHACGVHHGMHRAHHLKMMKLHPLHHHPLHPSCGLREAYTLINVRTYINHMDVDLCESQAIKVALCIVSLCLTGDGGFISIDIRQI